MFGNTSSPNKAQQNYGFGAKFNLHEKSVQNSSIHDTLMENSVMQSHSRFSAEYDDAIQILEHNKFYFKDLPVISAVTK